MELISLHWLSCEESDLNLVKLADMMGIPARSVALGARDTGADIHEISGLADTGGRVVTSARTLAALASQPAGSSKLELLLSNARHLFVYGFESRPSHESLLRNLSCRSLTSVNEVDSACYRYRVSDKARDFCRQLGGLSFGPVDPGNDCTFGSNARGSHLRELISIEGRDFFVQLDRGPCNLALLASRRIANIDLPVRRGVSPLQWFSQLVPAMMFVRHAFGAGCWHNDTPRGCFVIDDPLLKRNYGFLDYEDLLQSMKRHGFTTSVAFIPWNHSRTSARNAGFFRSNSDKYSLCVHGCDHTKAEFGSTDPNHLRRKVDRATTRMVLHEKRTGLRFDKVMVFPQGVFSTVALKALKSCRYVAAVNSTAYPVDCPPDDLRLRDLLDVAVLRYQDFPLFLRHYPVDIRACAFALFLGRPLLLVEHHEYFKQGCHDLESFVQQIQSLDPQIVWGDLESACVNSCLKRVDDQSVIHLKIYTDRITIANTDSERKHYLVWRQERDSSALIGLSQDGKRVAYQHAQGAITVSLQLAPGEVAQLRLHYRQPETLPELRWPGFIDASKVYLRRHLCEFRDDGLSKNKFLSRLIRSGRECLGYC